MDPLISIIIPACNCEKTIGHTIESIMSQVYAKWELIIVDDGSTDSTGSICDDYKAKDNRITVVHKINGGVSKARNTGIGIARGKYIAFVDSDDLLFENTLETAVKQIGIFGLLIYGYETFPVVLKQAVALEKIYKSCVELTVDYPMLAKQHLINSPWNKLYRADLIHKYSIEFPPEKSMGEDLLFNIQYMKICGQIKVINDVLYKYRIESNNSLRTKVRLDAFKIQKELKLAVDENFGISPDTLFFSNCDFINVSIGILKNIVYSKELRKNEKTVLISEIIKDEELQKSITAYNSLLGKSKKLSLVNLVQRKLTTIIYYVLRIRYYISLIIH